MSTLQLHYGDRAPYTVRAASFVAGSTVSVVASDSEAVIVEPHAFEPLAPLTPGGQIVVAQGEFVGGRKMLDGVRVHAKITHPDGGVTHAKMETIDVVGSPIELLIKEPVPMTAAQYQTFAARAETPYDAPLTLREAEHEAPLAQRAHDAPSPSVRESMRSSKT